MSATHLTSMVASQADFALASDHDLQRCGSVQGNTAATPALVPWTRIASF
jgi:hypothetical protein